MSEPERPLAGPTPCLSGEHIRVVSHRPAREGAGVECGPTDIAQLAHCHDVIGLNAVSAATVAGWLPALDGWRVFAGACPLRSPRAQTPDNVILWRQDAFSRMARGRLALPGTSAPVTWVRLCHRDSGVIITWIQCQVDPGTPPNSLVALLDLARSAGEEGEVLVAGDWGRCARAARERPHPFSPFAVLEQDDDPSLLPGLRSTYSFFGFTTPATSGPVDHGEYRHHLAVLRRADPTQRALAFTSHRVLSQFPLDHRPIRAVVQVHPDRTGLPAPAVDVVPDAPLKERT